MKYKVGDKFTLSNGTKIEIKRIEQTMTGAVYGYVGPRSDRTFYISESVLERVLKGRKPEE